jgi:ribosomal subunit interface protein
MLIITKGKNLAITPSLRTLAQNKVARLERYLPAIELVEVEFSVEPTKSVVDRQIVQLTLQFYGNL